MQTILEDEEKSRLLKEMFSTCDIGTNEFEAKRFRATHHQCRDKIDELERAHFIERSNNIYKLNLIALAELEESIPACKLILDACEVIFQDLKQEYFQEPEQTIQLINIAHKYGINPELISISTPYLLQASIFGSYNLGEGMGACVTTREEILDYNNFRECIERLQGYSLQAVERFSSLHAVPQATYSAPKFGLGLTDIQPLLHSEILKHAYPHYRNGHLREAVLNSIMAISDMIREKTKLEEDGDRLIIIPLLAFTRILRFFISASAVKLFQPSIKSRNSFLILNFDISVLIFCFRFYARLQQKAILKRLYQN